MNSKGFTVFITGGSSGLGFEMAKALLGEGATVAIAARPGARLDNAFAALKENGGDVYAVPMDVRDEEAVKRAAVWTEEHFGHLDMLVNNAGVGNNVGAGPDAEGRTPQIFDIPTEAFRTIVETNFYGYFLVTKAFTPMMVKAGRGRIVNVSTSDATMTMKGQIPYGPARAAAEAMSKILSQELCEFGITVNVLCPGGATDTGMATDDMREMFRKMGRTMLPASIMNEAILYLASPEAEGLNGEKIIGNRFHEWLAERKQ
ncbi:MAG: SDR family oxidoreductase [Eubacterium sp.]|nr:SDR family oxidoreductase [Eubacterium sp.]